MLFPLCCISVGPSQVHSLDTGTMSQTLCVASSASKGLSSFADEVRQQALKEQLPSAIGSDGHLAAAATASASAAQLPKTALVSSLQQPPDAAQGMLHVHSLSSHQICLPLCTTLLIVPFIVDTGRRDGMLSQSCALTWRTIKWHAYSGTWFWPGECCCKQHI